MYKIGHFIFDIIGIDQNHIPINFKNLKQTNKVIIAILFNL